MKVFSRYWASPSERAARDKMFCQKFSISGRPVILKKPALCKESVIVFTLWPKRLRVMGV